jgi:hypothetical protein
MGRNHVPAWAGITYRHGPDYADGLRVLLARDRAVEDWLCREVGAAYDALKAEPARALDAEAVKARLSAAHQKASAKG